MLEPNFEEADGLGISYRKFVKPSDEFDKKQTFYFLKTTKSLHSELVLEN